MTLFRLEIPAGDYEGRILADCDTVRLNVPGVGTVQVPVDAVAPVTPPLPAIPDALAVAIGDHVFARDDDANGAFFACPGAPVCHKRGYDWVELNELAANEGKPIIPLRPDPAVDLPDLPWTALDASGGVIARVALTEGVTPILVQIEVRDDDYLPSAARDIGAALFAAADQVESKEDHTDAHR